MMLVHRQHNWITYSRYHSHHMRNQNQSTTFGLEIVWQINTTNYILSIVDIKKYDSCIALNLSQIVSQTNFSTNDFFIKYVLRDICFLLTYVQIDVLLIVQKLYWHYMCKIFLFVLTNFIFFSFLFIVNEKKLCDLLIYV